VRSAATRSLALLAFAAPLALASSCTGDDVTAEVRSLDRAGRVSVVCMGAPGSAAALRPLGDCTALLYDTPRDYGSDGSAPHLYALVTLEARGEVAVLDLSTEDGNVLDQDPSTPGENALPVGAQPVAIASTPKATATFVASAEVGRPAIYALPAELVRPCEADSARCEVSPLTLSSWPVCRLPSAPGDMVMIADPAVDGAVRPSCEEAYVPVDASAPAFGDIDKEGLGRQKLVVALPKVGQLAVIDAQALLTSPPGAIEDCPIERTVSLSGDAPPASPPPIDPGPACAVPELAEPRPAARYPVTPGGMAVTDDRLLVADLTAPVIHVVDVASPCSPTELPPLLPTSAEEPDRVVYTSKVAVSPEVSPDLKRYAYAVDVADRSVMAFDVSVGATSREPIQKPRPELNPLQPPDRVRFGAAPTDLVIVQRDEPRSSGQGLAPFGTRCDPNAAPCSAGSVDCAPGALYQTTADFEDGAGPYQLRGTFALVALASGQVAVIDIDDYDAACRGPVTPSESAGCLMPPQAGGPEATGEPSCNVSSPHEPRAGTYILTNDDVGRSQPGVQSFPTLSLEDGTVITDGPMLLAPQSTAESPPATLVVGGDVLEVPPERFITDEDGPRNTLLFNLEDPRVQLSDQEWAILYQGALPAFASTRGDLRLSAFERVLVDQSAGFCRGGVQSEQAVRAELAADGVTGAELDAAARRLADRLHVDEALGAQDGSYWDTAACTYQECRAAFGDVGTPTPARDLVILEAYEDHLDLAPPQGVTEALFECCFPTLISYEVRPGDEWIVVGGASGFLHHTISDADNGGVCRPSCDPRLVWRQSRARAGTDYRGPLFRFTVTLPDPAAGGSPPQRDMAFRFITQGSFVPLRAVLTNEDRPGIHPRQIGYARAVDEIFVTDGGFEGVLLVPGDFLGDFRQVF
jgi:hypothetical protein